MRSAPLEDVQCFYLMTETAKTCLRVGLRIVVSYIYGRVVHGVIVEQADG